MGSKASRAFWVEWKLPNKKKSIRTYIEAETPIAAKRELAALLSDDAQIGEVAEVLPTDFEPTGKK